MHIICEITEQPLDGVRELGHRLVLPIHESLGRVLPGTLEQVLSVLHSGYSLVCRYSVGLIHRWGVHKYSSEEEPPRPQYIEELNARRVKKT